MMTQLNNKNKLILKILLIAAGIILIAFLAIGAVRDYRIHRTEVSILTSSQLRSFLLHLPEGYRLDQSLPLVISIHGYNTFPVNQAECSHWNEMADEYNFIAVYPRGSGSPLYWSTSGQYGAKEDVQFFADIIDYMEKEYHIDRTRVYVNGLSNGGGMSFALACELSDRIAAIGSVSGAYVLPWEKCNPEQPVPAIFFHGTGDDVVPYEGSNSTNPYYSFPAIPEWVETYAAQNGCDPNAQDLPAKGNASGKRYTNCTQNADVILYTIDQGGHEWGHWDSSPESAEGKDLLSVDATRTMWEFFQQYSLQK